MWPNGAFIPKLLNNQLASCSLRKFNFLVSYTTHFDEIISFLLYTFATFGFLQQLLDNNYASFDKYICITVTTWIWL